MEKEEQQTTAQQAAEQQAAEQPKTKREVFLANMRTKYPDIEDEDELYGAAMEGYDKEHEWGKTQREQNAKLADAIGADPQLAAFIAEIYERGKDGHPEMAFHNLGDAIRGYATGELTSDEYLREKERLAAEKADNEARQAKQEEAYRAWAEKKGYDPEEWLGRANDKLFSIMSKYELGEEQFEALDKMLNYDEDIASAAEAARVQEANKKITDAKMREKVGDGVPHPASEGAVPPENEPGSTIEKIARERSRRRTFAER